MKLSAWMKKNDLDLAQMAAVLDCAATSVSVWLNGHQLPSLLMMSRIKTATGGEVDVDDFVVAFKPRAAPPRRPGRRVVTDQQVDDWLRSNGLRAVSTVLAYAPSIPFSASVLQRYIRGKRHMPRWSVKVSSVGKPSRWIGQTAIDVSDSYRILQSMRGRDEMVNLLISEVVR